MAQGMMAIDEARRNSGRIDSISLAKRSFGSSATGAAGADATAAAISCRGASGRGAGGADFGDIARKKGLVRKRRGAVIFHERLLCRSVVSRRRLFTSSDRELARVVSVCTSAA